MIKVEHTKKKSKRQQNKEKLVQEALDDIWNDIYAWEDYAKGLCKEALMKRTQAELKQILGYES